MAKNSPSTVERLFNLSAYLLRVNEPVTLQRIIYEVEGYDAAKDYETNRRKFLRDRKELDKLGMNVESVRAPDDVSGHITDCYIIDEKDFFLPKINLTHGEREALVGLGEYFSGTGADPVVRELEWALVKLAGTGEQSSQSAVQVNFGNPAGVDSETLDTIRSAISERRRISVFYKSVNSDEKSEREIDPYGLFLRRGAWYLCGHCHLRGEMRTFRLDRLELTRNKHSAPLPHFDVPPDFSLVDQVNKRAPWEFGGAPTTEAVVEFHPEFYWQVKNSWGDVSSANFDDSAHRVTICSVNDSALVSWILEFADRAKIVSPEPLQQKLIAILENAKKYYG